MSGISQKSSVRNTVPARIEKVDVSGFISWLAKNGAEIGMPTNPYEVVRYKSYTDNATKPMTSVVYRKDSGLVTWTGASFKHYQRFLDGENWLRKETTVKESIASTFKAPSGLSVAAKHRAKLLKRDGDECWFCGLPMGDDLTIEHLVPKSDGGRNTLANYALAHKKCNNAAADKPLIQKIEIRNRMRGK